MNVLTIQGLSKAFGGQKIIDNLDMAVPEGSVFGFIGQNGAGKTTTMNMVLGLLRPDQGEIKVCNEPVRFGQRKTNQYIGYLPDVPEFYDYMAPARYLALCGEILGLSKVETQQRGEELLSLVGLENAKKTIGGFSRGMKQRLGIAQALLARPELLICDEPASALDPVGRKEILDILRKISGTTTVLFSTHILSDVERICDYAALLGRGKIIVGGTLAEIKALHGHESLLLEFPSDDALHTFKSQQAIGPIKNISGVGFSAVIILFGSCMSGEYSKGTLVLLITKGLPRSAVIFAKYTVAAVLMTVCYWSGFFAAYCYSAYLWPGAALPHVLTAAFYLWLIGFLYLSILLLGCVVFRQTFTSLLFTGGIVAVISLLGMVEPLAKFNPFLLTSKNVDLISGAASVSEFLAPAMLAAIITAAGLWAAALFFGRKQL